MVTISCQIRERRDTAPIYRCIHNRNRNGVTSIISDGHPFSSHNHLCIMPTVESNDGLLYFNMQHNVHPSSSWQPAPQNPYPVLPIPPPVPQLPHKVFILDCATCNTFLTNRGMKAVLLLRPDISLYSTDAFPINCSAQALSEPARSSGSRTCDCLTQTISCHGCGSNVGYMIVLPCARCTSSINVTNRSTNGHRFVFHAGEVIGSQRLYVSNEPGVMPFHATSPSHTSNTQVHLDIQEYIHTPSLTPPHLEPAEVSIRSLHSPFATPPSSTSSLSELWPATTNPHPPPFRGDLASPHDQHQIANTTGRPRSPPNRFIPAITQRYFAPMYQSLSELNYAFMPPQDRDAKVSDGSDASSHSHGSRRLKPGDILYWHNLTRHGEIPGVKEDSRARRKTSRHVWACR